MGYESGELKEFVRAMEREIKRVGAPSVKKKEEFLRFQEDQVNGIVELERQLRDELLARGLGQRVYEAFCAYAKTLSSIMSSRSYFRERQEKFVDVLGPAIESGDWQFLATYRINFRFITWLTQSGIVTGDPFFVDLERRIRRLRSDMVILLMPLAISRTRIFRGKTPPSHLGLQDLVQSAFEGLLCSVDKYVPPFSSVYRGVAIGRITGELIESYSQTLLHFYPNDRKVLYRANKLHGKMNKGLGGTDYDAMARRLNADAVAEAEERVVERVALGQPAGASSPSFQTDAAEVAELMAASSHVSADALVGARRAIARMTAPEDQAPDRQAEVSEGVVTVRRAARGLSLVQRKMLTLRGMLSVEEEVAA